MNTTTFMLLKDRKELHISTKKTKPNQYKLKRNEQMAKTKNRIKKMNFQSQTRTYTPLTEEHKYIIQRLVKDRDVETDNENVQRITRGSLRPQYI
jgi:hypothetical protein